MHKEIFALGAEFAHDDKRRVSGYALLFDTLSEDLGGFRTKIAPTAINLRSDVLGLFSHDTSKVLGRTSAGTLTLSKDARGLAFSLDLPNTTIGNDTLESVKRGDIKGCSFGCYINSDSWDTSGPLPIRTIKAADVFEISLVSMPAFSDTSAALASLFAHQQRNSMPVSLLERIHRLNIIR
jgi:HK97 family phage prohead protease